MKVLDWHECLELNNHNVSAAKELLTMFAKDLPNTQAKIQKAVKEQNFADLEYVVHRLLGACCYCSVPRLKEKAEQLEAAAKQHDAARVAHLMPGFEQEVDLVIEALKAQSFA